jgi:reductive dehalogenase
MSESAKKSISRRDLLKCAGIAGVAAQAGGLVAAGKQAGKSSESYTGWESFNPGTQFVDRKPFEFEGPAHKPVGKVRRPSHSTDYVFGRVMAFQRAFQAHPNWKLNDPLEDLELGDELIAFYREFPDRLEWDFKTFTETVPNNSVDRKKYGNYYRLAEAYEAGFSAHSGFLRGPTTPPEESDFQASGFGNRKIGDPVPFKNADLASEFIKEMAHRYGATLVGITKTNTNWLYSEGWRGCPQDYDFSKMPSHWENAIVIGVPMEWDVVMSNPQFGTSNDGYDRVTTAAVRLEGMLKNLGYPARSHTPNTNYDLIVPPHAVEAGLGELGRTGFCITPEAGGNCRMAIVTTNIPLTIDHPIDYGIARFCSKCKLCAESCPSGSISMADSPDGLVIRGYEHWYINNGSCFNFWRETMGPMGCRLCVATCPYSRKDNWIHDLARKTDSHDPTGMVSSGLLLLQKRFFPYPAADEYRRPPQGHFASFRPPPPYLEVEKYLDIPVTKPPRQGG